MVVLTTYADDQSVFGALQAGARGFLTKDAGADEIRTAVLSVAAGEGAGPWCSAASWRPWLRAHVGIQPAAPEPVDDGLTAMLDCSPSSRASEQHRDRRAALRVGGHGKTHVNHLLAKTACRDRAALVAYAYRTGRVPPD